MSGYKKFILIQILIFFYSVAESQCPGEKFFNDKINDVYNSATTNIDEKLNELLNLEIEMKACKMEKDSCFLFLMQKAGVVCYKKAEYDKAINFTKRSIGIAKEKFANHSCSVIPLINSYSNLYYFYNASNQSDKKYEAIDTCIAYALKYNDGYNFILKPLTEKVDYLFNTGNYNSCVTDAKLGQNLVEKYYHNSNDSIIYLAYFLRIQANALYLSGSIDAAEKLLKGTIYKFNHTNNNSQLGPFYGLLGLIKKDRREYSTSAAYLKKSLQLDSLIKFYKGCVQDLATIGSLYATYFGEVDSGLRLCYHALKFADNNDSLLIFQEIANVYVLKKDFPKAQYFFQQSFNTIQYKLNETTVLQNALQFPGFNELQSISDLITAKGDAFVQEYLLTRQKKNLIIAINIYRKNDLFLEKIKRDQQLDLASNLVWKTTARNLYEHAIEACYLNDNIEDAFYFFEKSRAVLLNDQVSELRSLNSYDIAQQSHLKKTISNLEIRLNYTTPSPDEYFAILKDLYFSNEQLRVLNETLKNKNRSLQKIRLDTASITIARLQRNILSVSKSLIEIFSGDSAVYILTITDNNQSLSKLNKKLYDSLVNSFTSAISNSYMLNEHFKNFVKTSQQLYHLLFQNVQPSDGSIIISPDGKGYPFEALVMNNNDREPDYFLNHYATSYTYSVKYLMNQFAANTSNNSSVLGIAPVVYKNYENLAGLAGSDESLKIINKYFSKATNFILKKATKNNFFKYFPDYTIIQLYTHAADSSHSNDPVIYFADSALYLSDLIPDRKPVTQLVVLSACETANGKLYQGEGIFSFNRGFAALGIPAAISNLWSVENESTYKITELFYKYLSRGLPTDVALQKAKLDFIHTASSAEKKLPYFWAGSILTGKVDIFKSPDTFPWITFSGLMILLMIMIYSIHKVLRLRNRRDNNTGTK